MKNEALGFLGGAIVGAALALLFAPESGEKTRRRIGKFVQDEKGKLVDAYGSAMNRLDDEAQKIEELLHRG